MSAERIADRYVHGYTEREHARLVDQATTLTDLLHHDTRQRAADPDRVFCYTFFKGVGVK
jgi:hypothetical protein